MARSNHLAELKPRARAIELAAVDVRRGDVLPDLDGVVEGHSSEDGAKLRMHPSEF